MWNWQIILWNDYIKYAKELDNRLKLYFIFNPSKDNESSVKAALKTAYFNYPLILDTESLFETLNPHLPKNKAFHTFLLDKKNNLILAGSPLKNKEINKIFMKIITNILTKKTDTLSSNLGQINPSLYHIK